MRSAAKSPPPSLQNFCSNGDDDAHLFLFEGCGSIRFRWGVLLVFLLVFLNPWLGFSASSGANLFDEANKLYEQKQYPKASRDYENLMEHGTISPAILFNAGNAAFKSKRFGHAIVLYREAQRFAPRDPDIQANLRFVRNTVENGTQVISLGERICHIFTLNELTVLTSIALWLWFGLLALREWRPPLRPALRGYTLLTGIVFGAAALWLGTAVVLIASEHSGVIVADEAAARFGPVEESQVAFTLRDGNEVQVLAQRPGWIQIKDSRGRHGWVAANSVEQVPTFFKSGTG